MLDCSRSFAVSCFLFCGKRRLGREILRRPGVARYSAILAWLHSDGYCISCMMCLKAAFIIRTSQRVHSMGWEQTRLRREKSTWLCTFGRWRGIFLQSRDCLVNHCSFRQVATYLWRPVIHWGILLACQTYKSLEVPFPSENAVKQSHILFCLLKMACVKVVIFFIISLQRMKIEKV